MTWGVAATLAAASCGVGEAPRRSCVREIWARPGRPGAQVSVIGSWDGWLAPGRPLAAAGIDDWQWTTLGDLAPGEYGYLIYEEGEASLDPHNPLTTFWLERDLEVSLLTVERCEAPAIEVREVRIGEGGRVSMVASFLAGEGGAPVDPGSVTVRLRGGAEITPAQVDARSGAIEVDAAGLGRGKHSLVVEARDVDGRAAAPARAIAWVEAAAPSWEAGVIYQVMIDRFRGDGGAPLAPPPTPGSRAGGTLDGVRAALEDGSLEALGVTALWLSPVYLGPDEARLGRGDGHLYEGYHGYWVLESREVDPRVGGEAALRRLVEAAHARGIAVLLDIVPNHIYEANPRYAAHRDQGWFNLQDPPCVCGLGACPWGEFIQTCWFTDYLPDLRLEVPEVARLAVEDAIWWADAFDLDGVRIDAVPMMPRAATRRLAAGLRESVWPRGQGSMFLLGEIFTGPGRGGIDAYRYFLGPGSLDSAFDFPLMWALRDVIARRSAGFEAVEAMLAETDAALAGSGAVLGRIIGNHDTTRFLSEIVGDAGGDPWSAPPIQPSDPATAPAIYERQALALGLMFTLPGTPVLYYGDEVGLAGGEDPDDRRVMPAEEALSPEQVAVRAHVQRLGALRRCSRAIQAGARRPVTAAGPHLAFVRDVGDGAPALIVASNAEEATLVAVFGADLPAGEYVDALSGDALTLSEAATVPMPPRSLRALVPRGSPCAL